MFDQHNHVYYNDMHDKCMLLTYEIWLVMSVILVYNRGPSSVKHPAREPSLAELYGYVEFGYHPRLYISHLLTNCTLLIEVVH